MEGEYEDLTPLLQHPYQAIEAEWENTLEMALTPYFPTRFNLNLCYDDAVHLTKAWNRHLQYETIVQAVKRWAYTMASYCNRIFDGSSKISVCKIQ